MDVIHDFIISIYALEFIDFLFALQILVPGGQEYFMASRPDVLVVDDDPSQCLEIAEYLHRRGFEVLEANDAQSALQIMETRTMR